MRYMLINELYYQISPDEKERNYVKKKEGQYGAALLIGSERRIRAILRKQATEISTYTESEQRP